MRKLSLREKLFILGGSVILAVLFLTVLVIRPLMAEHERYRSDISKVRRDVQLFERLKEEYRVLKAKSEQVDRQLKNRKKSFTLFSLLENIAEKVEIKELIKYMKPSTKTISDKYEEVSVEIKLAGITPKQLTDYLYDIENSDALARVKRVTIYPMKNSDGLLEATLQVFTYKLKGV